MSPENGLRTSYVPVFISFVSLIVAIASATFSYWGVSSTANKYASDKKTSDQRDWQTTVIYNVIVDAGKTDPNGIAFEDILTKYVVKASADEKIEFEKEKLQPLELRRILMGLVRDKMIYNSPDDRY